MLVETIRKGDVIIFNGKEKTCITAIKNNCVMFSTKLLSGKNEISHGELNQIVTLTGIIQVKILEIDNHVKLKIESPKNMVVHIKWEGDK